MTAVSGLGARVASAVAYDAPLSRALLFVWHHFAVSAQFIACLVPALAFTALVGWQPTHLAIVLGVVSLAPAGPGLAALAAVSDARLDPLSDVRTGRWFWTAYARATRELWWWWLAATGVALLLAYDLALFGASDTVLVGVVLAATVLVVFSIGLSDGVRQGASRRPVAALAAAGTVLVRRPVATVTRFFLVWAVAAAPAIPLIGWSLLLFAPSLAASADALVARAGRRSHA